MRKFRVNVNGETFEVEIEEVGGTSQVTQNAPVSTPAPAAPTAQPKSEPVQQTAAPQKPKEEAKPAAKAPTGDGEQVTAPLPGTILDLKVKPGENVEAGDVLLVLEAMKMENEVVAPVGGTVQEILVEKGATVNSGDVLATIG